MHFLISYNLGRLDKTIACRMDQKTGESKIKNAQWNKNAGNKRFGRIEAER